MTRPLGPKWLFSLLIFEYVFFLSVLHPYKKKKKNTFCVLDIFSFDYLFISKWDFWLAFRLGLREGGGTFEFKAYIAAAFSLFFSFPHFALPLILEY